MSIVHLARTVYDGIIDHAREGKPEEICGILRGREGRATQLYRARNLAEDRIDNYDVDPQTLLRQFEFEEAGDEMVAIYHSHPVSVAYPSATDAWNAHYPETYYLICSLEFDDAPVIRAFRMEPQWPDADLGAARDAIPFDEVRPGLFGYFQAHSAPVPRELGDFLPGTALPLYVVFATDEAGTVDDFRVVGVKEFPVHISEGG
ncbi:MAG: M67 family metallopeptidase [Caldilineaceae bacterium]|nr:M67 family metallopeptidase [Caldilineaceae bacterium]